MPDDMVDAHIHGVTNALAAGWRVLDRDGTALDAVEGGREILVSKNI